MRKKLMILSLLVFSISNAQVSKSDSNNGTAKYAITDENKNKIIYVDAKATGNDDGKTWENAKNSLANALIYAMPGNQIWIASDNFKLSATDKEKSSKITKLKWLSY